MLMKFGPCIILIIIVNVCKSQLSKLHQFVVKSHIRFALFVEIYTTSRDLGFRKQIFWLFHVIETADFLSKLVLYHFEN